MATRKTKKEKAPEQREYVEADGIPVWCSHDRLLEVESLVPNPRNPNMHTAEQIDLLAKVISIQGWRAPITVSLRSGFITKGHGRLFAGRKLGVTMVPVDEQEYENEAAEWSDMIADNKLAELSSLDDTMLNELIADIGEMDFDLELTGFDHTALEKIISGMESEIGDLGDAGNERHGQGEGGGTSSDFDESGKVLLVFNSDSERAALWGLLGLDDKDKREVVAVRELPAMLA